MWFRDAFVVNDNLPYHLLLSKNVNFDDKHFSEFSFIAVTANRWCHNDWLKVNSILITLICPTISSRNIENRENVIDLNDIEYDIFWIAENSYEREWWRMNLYDSSLISRFVDTVIHLPWPLIRCWSIGKNELRSIRFNFVRW